MKKTLTKKDQQRLLEFKNLKKDIIFLGSKIFQKLFVVHF